MAAVQSVWLPVYIGVGSNLDTPEAHVRTALDELAEIDGTRGAINSELYRSAPLGPQNQPDYINAACGFLTGLEPLSLLKELLLIEVKHGRIRDGSRWGPRTLDLDMLVFGDRVLELDRLTIPHPGVHERNFVLYPLADIAPTLYVPGRGRVDKLAAALDRASLTRLKK